MKEIIKGTREQRINRMTRMALEWQDDARTPSQLKKSSYYFRKYHIGPYKVDFFSDIKTANINREWILNKMQLCSEHKKVLKNKLLNRKLNEVHQPSLFDDVKVTDENIVLNELERYNDSELIDELKKRQYVIFKKY